MNRKKDIITLFVWLFIIGCILGYVAEVLWYFIKHGIWINKQGLLYGPFKPIYGLGIALISMIFNKFKDKKSYIIFLSGVIFGSIYEYVLSVFQEYVLHTSTWNYSSFNYNLNGRIYLPYCIIWGIAALIWFKFLYSKIKKAILKIPFTITSIVAIIMIINVLLSGIAVYEYSNRQNNIKPKCKILETIDKMYPDNIIEKKYPKLKVIKKD